MTNSMELQKNLPDKPGVYLMHDSKDTILYVGKAKSLKKRVKSYFREDIDDPKTRALMRQYHHLGYMVTDSEKEALILESNLIKKHLPRYNIRLKDDKRYPYLKITREDYPRLLITRKFEEDKAEYYGPYTDVKAVRRIIKFLKPIFRIRDCKKMDGPCLNYQIKLCQAPCSGKISKKEYNKQIKQIRLFLEGRYQDVKIIMQDEMELAASHHEYEKAAALRDQLNSLDDILEKQKMELNRNLDQDVVAASIDVEMALVVVFSLREGKIMSKEDFIMEGVSEALEGDLTRNSTEDIFSAFLKQYYSGPRQIPGEIMLPHSLDEQKVIEEWLSDKKGHLVQIKTPETTMERSMVRMVAKNAKIIKDHQKEFQSALMDLKHYLKMPSLPRRIEAFDISNISGQMAVGSMVVFIDGKPKKRDYRRFKIKTSGPDDYGMMKELLERRYSKVVDDQAPDLILVDGGRGQLNIALEVLKVKNVNTRVIGLAKEYEHVFVPEFQAPIILPATSPSLHLLQRIRDEAHRFAITYHKKLRSKNIEHSLLDEIPGVGPKRKRDILNHFGSLECVKSASVDEIAKVKGISKKLAQKIHQFLQ
ncbi:MAG TPA: excinuclease ABC subunit UvrC [Methanobacteriaceae archaeon]|nr:excinuclease ABC subunit UvrC [Methanobacteriaceae archaeon]